MSIDKLKAAAAKRIKEQKEAEKAGRKRRQEKRESLKSKSQWDKEAQSAFNRYIRIRDEGKECVSCGNPLLGKSNYLTGSASMPVITVRAALHRISNSTCLTSTPPAPGATVN